MRSFCSLRVNTETAEGTRSGEAERVFPIDQRKLDGPQFAFAALRSGYSLLSAGMVQLAAKSGRQLFASACCLSSAFVRLGCKLSVSSVFEPSGPERRWAVGFFCRIKSVRMH